MSSGFVVSPDAIARLIALQNDQTKPRRALASGDGIVRLGPVPDGGATQRVPMGLQPDQSPDDGRAARIMALSASSSPIQRAIPPPPSPDAFTPSPPARMRVGMDEGGPMMTPGGVAARVMPPVDGQVNFENITKPDAGAFSRALARSSDPGDGFIRSDGATPDLSAISFNPAVARAIQPGGAQQRALAMLDQGIPQHHGSGGIKGFFEHLKDGGKLALEAMATGTNPLVAGVMGIAGAVNPQLEHNFNYNMKLPRVMQQAEMEADLQNRQLQRANMGNQIALGPLKARNINSQIDRRDSQTDQGDTRNDINSYKAWAASAAPGTVIPDDYADLVHAPRGSQVWHNTRTGEHYLKGKDGTAYQVKDGVATQVKVDGSGEPFQEYTTPPPPRVLRTDQGYAAVTPGQAGAPPTVQPVPGLGGRGVLQPPVSSRQTPSFVYQGRARAELQKEMGVTNPSAMVANPAFTDAFNQAKAAEQESARRYGYPMPSDAEISAQVSKKVPSKVKAGTLITPDMVSERAASIYDRERGGKGKAAPSGRASANQPQMAAHESEYQRLYPKLSPEDRQKMEQAFQQQYGRAPKRPQ